MNTEKFLDFHGKKITLVNSEGIFYIAIKPICEILKVEWIAEFKRLKSHLFFSSTIANQTMVASDKRQREMVCLPEKFIYGWICSLKPKSKELVTFQIECYSVLYNHFHLKQAARETELQSRTLLDEKIEALEATLKQTIEFEELETLKTKRKAINQTLAAMDKGIYQTALF